MISVIVPLYNAKKYLKNLIEDIEGQTYKDFEVILVDNNSDDGSYEELLQLTEGKANFQVVKEEQRGPNYARKHGLECAKGEFIYFYDADDRLFSYTLETLYKKMLEKDADLVIADYCEIDEMGHIKKECKGINFQCSADQNLKDTKDVFFVKMPLWNKLFRKTLIQDNFFVYSSIGEDMLISLSCLAASNRVFYAEKTVYKYLVTDSGLSYQVRLSNITGIVQTCRQMDKIFRKNFPAYLEETEFVQIQHLLYRLLRSVLLNKKEQTEARKELIPYIRSKEIKKNKYFVKSFAFRMAYFLLVNEKVYGISSVFLKLIFKNKIINRIFKKMDK